MEQYLNHLKNLMDFGHKKGDRTGTGTSSIFGTQQRYDLTDGAVPLLTTKKVLTRSVIHELIWFIKGSGNIKYLSDNDVHIWDDWADENGELGPVYGVQWRHWEDTRIIPKSEWEQNEEYQLKLTGSGYNYEGHLPLDRVVISREIDQLADVIDQLNNNPDSRRIILTSWNPSVIEEQKLPPCHSFVQFFSRELSDQERIALANSKDEWRGVNFNDFDKSGVPSRALSCQLYQRSADWFLGVPFNISSYAILTHMLAQITGHVAEEFIHTCGDSHLYDNHQDQAVIQSHREIQPMTAKIDLNPHVRRIDDFTFDDVKIKDYEPQGFIKAPVAV